MDTSFSDDEKRFVLSEMIKVSSIDIGTLVEFIKFNNVQPNWMFMQLPGGRNMKQCVGAAENMFNMKFPPPNLGQLGKRKSLGDIQDHHAPKRLAMAPFEPPLAPARVIQPRPPPNGFQPPVAPPSAPSVSTVTATGKKRGRPSKADKEAQAQARAVYARPTEYTPITPAPPVVPQVAPPAPPLAPVLVQPLRDYVSTPGYDIASGATDQSSKKRSRPNAIDSPRQGSGTFPLASPASTTGTPRVLPEPPEPVAERSNISPRASGSAPSDSRSPPLVPLMQQQQQQQQHEQPHIRLQPRISATPILPSPRLSQVYDPIFPDRDRSRNMPDHVARESPASPVVSRT
ncbi:hypothetical protein F5Y16DRAFT_15979 [Xylariaceae sp. FL0255]|nr:hypothetical protein F5Y16DRAFT_15979 [Xylariaceae sp. FL0255]